MRVFRFRTVSNARHKAQAMKRAYGYTPRVFKETNRRTRKSMYVVVKPTGLRRI